MKPKEIIGYFPSWAYYKKPEFNTDWLPFDKLSALIYAFFVPEDNGNIKGLDGYADELLLKGEIDWTVTTETQKFYKPNTSIVSKAKKHNCKFLISIGGWAHSSNFPIIASEASKRANFVANCVQLIKEFQIDGIDIDWEYPGYKDHNGKEEDYDNFILLMKELRNALSSINQNIILSCTIPAIEEYLNPLDVETLQNYVDFLHVFTFDFASLGVTRVVHNAALYTAENSPLEDSMDVVTQRLKSKNVSLEKVIVGLPFYGRAFKRTQPSELKFELFSDLFGDIDQQVFDSSDGTGEYYKIVDRENGFQKLWDKESKAPYLINDHQFITYENEHSIRFKCDYIKEQNIGGCFIWEITGDLMGVPNSAPKQPLLDAVVENL